MTTKVELFYDTGHKITHTLTKVKHPILDIPIKSFDISSHIYIQDHGSSANLRLYNPNQWITHSANDIEIRTIPLSNYPWLKDEDCLHIKVRKGGNLDLDAKINSDIRTIKIKHLS